MDALLGSLHPINTPTIPLQDPVLKHMPANGSGVGAEELVDLLAHRDKHKELYVRIRVKGPKCLWSYTISSSELRNEKYYGRLYMRLLHRSREELQWNT